MKNSGNPCQRTSTSKISADFGIKVITDSICGFLLNGVKF